MIVTEEEARTKVCPLMKAGGLAGSSPGADRFCIAGDCMKWNWMRSHSPTERKENLPWRGDDIGPPLGYCSL